MATLIERLKHEGHQVARYMLSHNPDAFVSDTVVYQALPIVTVEGAVLTMGQYPSYEDICGRQEG